MTRPTPASADAPPPISTRAGFEAAIRWAMRTSYASDARRIVWTDPDFAIWPLDDPPLLEALTAWLCRPQRKLVLLARDDQSLARSHPRFTAWRRDWTHAVEGWRLGAEVPLDVPTLYVDDGGVSVHLVDAVHWRGRAEADDRTAHLWRERTDALLQRSESGFAVHHLGL